jgi:hypothetical protein
LWDTKMEERVKRILPAFNRTVTFSTTSTAFPWSVRTDRGSGKSLAHSNAILQYCPVDFIRKRKIIVGAIGCARMRVSTI